MTFDMGEEIESIALCDKSNALQGSGYTAAVECTPQNEEVVV